MRLMRPFDFAPGKPKSAAGVLSSRNGRGSRLNYLGRSKCDREDIALGMENNTRWIAPENYGNRRVDRRDEGHAAGQHATWGVCLLGLSMFLVIAVLGLFWTRKAQRRHGIKGC